MPNHAAQDVAVLIPSYQPGNKLKPYVEQLAKANFSQIVIVDDGSGPEYAGIFGALEQMNGVTVLGYADNRGKGYALRHGMRHILNECADCAFAVTADSDGQHTVADILAMADALRQDSTGILLGTRDFSASQVPGKSRAGNRITSKVFHVLYGQKVEDTQTGLRGFARGMIPQFLRIRGDRYDYEMNQLIHCSIEGIPIRALPIETVYENNNAGSHFRTVVDSYRIYRVIFSRFLRFVMSSALCFLVDYGLYLLVNSLLKTYVPALNQYLSVLFISFVARIGIAAAVARVVSATLNFLINKRLVFDSEASVVKSFLRYAFTVVLIIMLSSSIVSTLYVGLGLSDTLTKIPVDIILFCLSYYIQRKWVFGGSWKGRGKQIG
ncbi:MAG: bifunctional glycosyltransferase family 2/GtrA family protein [Bacillota bacterium]